MKIQEITSYLESIAPLSLQENYDNSGLLTGNYDTDVTGILICLDSLEAIIDEAIYFKCNLVVAHHPIIFTGLKKLTGSNYIERTIIKAIQNNIAIYAIHTNLDNVHEGVNKRIADKLGLVGCRILVPKSNLLKKLVTYAPNGDAGDIRTALFKAGAGNIGNYSNCSFNLEGTGTFLGNESSNPFAGKRLQEHHENETRIEVIFPSFIEGTLISALKMAHPYEEVAFDIYRMENQHQNVGAGMIGQLPAPANTLEFLHLIKEKMECAAIRHTKILLDQVKTVAVCGGSGSSLLNEAIGAGADIFVTADFKYHQFFDADEKILVADIGHYESEHFTIELLHEILTKRFPTFAVHFSKINTNPVNYI